jgi:hypothetical protein
MPSTEFSEFRSKLQFRFSRSARKVGSGRRDLNPRSLSIIRINAVDTSADVLTFWKKLGFTENGIRRP